MFLRKLLGSSTESKAEPGRNGPPAGMQTMGPSLQRKFARGVQYNMKIIIKGDRNVGKSCLFYRLQGQKFKEEYIPTEEIQVASIQWNYKATDDVVKVEVWDVVDKGKKKKKLEGLKLENQDGLVPDLMAPGGVAQTSNQVAPGACAAVPDLYAEDACLDAEFIDVFKGTHGVIMVMDITKQWTFDYIMREVPKVPKHIPVLILANHRDMGHHRTVSEDSIKYYIDECDRTMHRGKEGAAVRYAETSMRNGFGLKYIHKFFNLPFLHLQKETLMRQLATNLQELEAVIDELDLHEESEEHDYDLFLDSLTSKRREQAEKLAEKALTDAKKVQEEVAKAEEATENKNVENGVKAPSPNGKGLREAPPPKPIKGLNLTSTAAPLSPGSNDQQPPTSSNSGTSPAQPTTPSQSVTPNAQSPTSPTTPVFTGTVPLTPMSPTGAMPVGAGPTTPGGTATTPGKEEKQGFMSRWFGSKKEKSPKQADELTSPSQPSEPVGSVEDFVPEEALDASFLEDTKESKTTRESSQQREREAKDSDSDDDGGNPMVAGFQEDLDSDDDLASPSNPVTMATSTVVASNAYDLSSDEEEVENVATDGPVITQDVDIESDDDFVIKTTIKQNSKKDKKSKRDSNKSEVSKVSKIREVSQITEVSQVTDDIDFTDSQDHRNDQKNGKSDSKTENTSKKTKSMSSKRSSSSASPVSDSVNSMSALGAKNSLQGQGHVPSADVDLSSLSSDSDHDDTTHSPSPDVVNPTVAVTTTTTAQKKSKNKPRTATTETFRRPHQSDDSDEEIDHHVTILGDLDYSDGDEEPISNQPVITVAMETANTDSGIATSDTTQENDGSLTSETKPPGGLELEDLSIFETGLSPASSLPRVSSLGSDLAISSSRADTDTDPDISSSKSKKKKHKHKDREKEKSEDGHKRSKHKKSKDRDRDRDKESSADIESKKDEEAKEKKKKKKKKKEEEREMNELEAFLGGDTSMPPGGGGGYESL